MNKTFMLLGTEVKREESYLTMAMLSLRIGVVGSNVIKTMQFDPSMIVFDACRILREKIPEANVDNRELLMDTYLHVPVWTCFLSGHFRTLCKYFEMFIETAG